MEVGDEQLAGLRGGVDANEAGRQLEVGLVATRVALLLPDHLNHPLINVCTIVYDKLPPLEAGWWAWVALPIVLRLASPYCISVREK